MSIDELVIWKFSKILLAQSAGAIEYTDCTSVEGQDPPTIVQDMTLNNVMVRFQ